MTHPAPLERQFLDVMDRITNLLARIEALEATNDKRDLDWP
jgi:hypothetical protein